MASSSTNSFANLTNIANLRTLHARWQDKFIEYQCEDSPDPVQISKAMDQMSEIDERINELECS